MVKHICNYHNIVAYCWHDKEDDGDCNTVWVILERDTPAEGTCSISITSSYSSRCLVVVVVVVSITIVIISIIIIIFIVVAVVIITTFTCSCISLTNQMYL